MISDYKDDKYEFSLICHLLKTVIILIATLIVMCYNSIKKFSNISLLKSLNEKD